MIKLNKINSSVLLIFLLAASFQLAYGFSVKHFRVAATPGSGRNPYYIGNRAPLLPSSLTKLPIGAIQPEGWLLTELTLMAKGMPGHLEEVSHWVRFKGSAWSSPTGSGENGWEELPYWLRGYGDLGYVLHDARIMANAKRWITAILDSQRPNGYFGPAANEINTDIWPNMLALFAVRSWYEVTGDKRVIPFMLRYFHWESQLPISRFLSGSWQKARGGDNLDSIYWLYNHTGQKWLLNLAQLDHLHTLDWTTGVHDLHGVDFAECFREPATYYQQAGNPKYLRSTITDYNYYHGIWGQVPGGMYGADETARKGYTGPRQAAETCAMVESMFSDEILEGITGDPEWADRCEDVAFNSLPAATTANITALHYLTAPNMVQLDTANKSPMVQDGGEMFAYDPGEVYRCCQHNYTMGWPYYAERLWMATGDKGLAAALYAPCTVKARVGDGSVVHISEKTNYPFRSEIGMKVRVSHPTAFPLVIRIPRWCSKPELFIDNHIQAINGAGPGWISVNRRWKTGDAVLLKLPMKIELRVWKDNRDSVSVYRGPLAYSLKIGERYKKFGGLSSLPAVDVYPTTPWNYGLDVSLKDPAASIHVIEKPISGDRQLFSRDYAPIELKAEGSLIPGWGQESNGMVEEVQQGPIRSDQPPVQITLIPMGAARLRISAFPLIGNGPGSHTWTAEDRSVTFQCSHLFENDSPLSFSHPLSPAKSSDTSIPRFTWWDHKGTKEWVQYSFQNPHTFRSSEVYWYDDTGFGQCRVPSSWRLLWWDGAHWELVKSSDTYGAQLNEFNRITFQPVITSRIRLLAQLQPNFSGGILAWKVSK